MSMFNREELLILSNEINNIELVNKINSMLYIDDNLIKSLIHEFSLLGLLYVEKVNCTNEYYVHFLVEDDSNNLKLVENVKLFRKQYYKDNVLKANLNIVIHNTLSDFWKHNGMEAYVRDDLKEYLNNKQ